MDHLYYLRKAIEVSKKSREHGNTPFGAILVDGEGNILLEQENIEITESNCSGHAETSLMIRASKQYSKDFYGIAHFIQLLNHVLCVQVLFIGVMWEKLFMVLVKNVF